MPGLYLILTVACSFGPHSQGLENVAPATACSPADRCPEQRPGEFSADSGPALDPLSGTDKREGGRASLAPPGISQEAIDAGWRGRRLACPDSCSCPWPWQARGIRLQI
jgi:hypothetical protein